MTTDQPALAGSRRYSLRTLSRAIALLEAIANTPPPVTMSTLARRTGIPKTTVHRLLTALISDDLVSSQNMGYEIGPRMHRLAQLVQARADNSLGPRLLPFLVELHERTGDLVALGVLDGPDVVVLQTIRGHRNRELVWDDRRRPAHCTALGRVLIAQKAAAGRWPPARTEPEPCEPGVELDRTALLAELGLVRSKGYARHRTTGGQVELAMPILDRTAVVAAVVRVRPGDQPLEAADNNVHRQITLAASAALSSRRSIVPRQP